MIFIFFLLRSRSTSVRNIVAIALASGVVVVVHEEGITQQPKFHPPLVPRTWYYTIVHSRTLLACATYEL